MSDYDAPSVLLPANLLREARRQRGLPQVDVPAIGLLDPDGDLANALRASGRSQPAPGWACYHTAMDVVQHRGLAVGVIGHAVGAPFAVLVAEQLFASGCQLLVSVTSAGWIGDGEPPRFMAIAEALRGDEGTSQHYLLPARSAAPNPAVLAAAYQTGLPGGVSWTTDAPYRETAAAIAAARGKGAVMVEMEAAGLYAFAAAANRPVLCIAHVTNSMAQREGDFEKGEDSGAAATLDIVASIAEAWQTPDPHPAWERA